MIIMSSSLFWGILIILAGILIILRMFSAFRNVSAVRIIAGIIIIYFGITLIIGKEIIVLKDDKGFFFNYYSNLTEGNNHKYKIFFSSQTIDFPSIENARDKNVKIIVVFGSGKIKINKNINFYFSGNVAFGGIMLPENNRAFFGQINYTSPSSSVENSNLRIKSDVVFGSLEVVKE